MKKNLSLLTVFTSATLFALTAAVCSDGIGATFELNAWLDIDVSWQNLGWHDGATLGFQVEWEFENPLDDFQRVMEVSGWGSEDILVGDPTVYENGATFWVKRIGSGSVFNYTDWYDDEGYLDDPNGAPVPFLETKTDFGFIGEGFSFRLGAVQGISDYEVSIKNLRFFYDVDGATVILNDEATDFIGSMTSLRFTVSSVGEVISCADYLESQDSGTDEVVAVDPVFIYASAIIGGLVCFIFGCGVTVLIGGAMGIGKSGGGGGGGQRYGGQPVAPGPNPYGNGSNY